MSFIVDRDGIVFQNALGPNTAALAAPTRLFDPDLNWARVDAAAEPTASLRRMMENVG